MRGGVRGPWDQCCALSGMTRGGFKPVRCVKRRAGFLFDLSHSYTYTVYMKNITLSVDEAILDKVRRIAADQKTTVNALVREYLTSVASREDRWAEAVRQMEALAAQSKMVVGSRNWTRDDIHER